VDPIDLVAFIALASSCTSRLEVPASWWCLEHLDVANVCLVFILGVLTALYSSAYKSAHVDDGVTTMASTTATAGSAHDCATVLLLEAVGPPGVAV
jgi:hypothetical protein